MTFHNITFPSPPPNPSPARQPFPAFLIGGTASGCGKTTITLGIMAAFKARGFTVQPFKTGPDFIDPSLHRMITGEISSNLDLQMCGEDFCREIMERRLISHGGRSGETVGVVEGVMGLFDGGPASSAALALALDLPVVLVVDAASAAESAAAMLKGFELYDRRLEIRGVIFNRVDTAIHQEMIRAAVQQSSQIRILGFFPGNIRFAIPDRHLGLHMGEESPLTREQQRELAVAMETHIDLDALLSLAAHRTAPPLPSRLPRQRPPSGPGASSHQSRPLQLAVARDLPFCFYYEDNLAMLKEAGFELRPFSPLHDGHLPEGMDALYLGGGYPELYAAGLSGNLAMRKAIAAWAASGGVIYGECGGFMYLCEELLDLEGRAYPMAGVFPATVEMRSSLCRLGYRRASLKRDCLWGKKGEVLHGHEFHYSHLRRMAPEVETLYQLEDGRPEGFRIGNTVGGYLHLHFGRTESAVSALYQFVTLTQAGRRSA
jgi:cobyrinic acid a,c-diamide synthase